MTIVAAVASAAAFAVVAAIASAAAIAAAAAVAVDVAAYVFCHLRCATRMLLSHWLWRSHAQF